jgi:hypothetical protein
MDLPVLPKELSLYLNFQSKESLFNALIKVPDDLVLFFESASNDETWSENNPDLMHNIIEWLTNQTQHDRLSQTNFLKAAATLRKYREIYKNLIPSNITVKFKDGEIQCNGLLLSGSSDFFRRILIAEARKQSNTVSFPQMTVNEFAPVQSFIATGEVPKLATKGAGEIIELIKRAKAWELPQLSQVCEQMLIKYIDDENVYGMLFQAKKEGWTQFERDCIAFINSKNRGFKLSIPFHERLAFEFLDFDEGTIEYFEQLRSLITDIICSGSLIEEPQFGLVLKSFPNLFCLDISRTLSFTNQLEEIPKGLNSLNISACPWVTKDSIKRLMALCPDLEQLFLQNDVHLNYIFWGELTKFKKLKQLDLSQCTQIVDTDLSIIVKGLNGLTELSLRGCKKISERGFLELARALSRLIKLNVSRSQISDTALVEVVSRCRFLTALDISSCIELSEKGVLSAVKHAVSLQELNIQHCNLPEIALEEIKRSSPALKLLV